MAHFALLQTGFGAPWFAAEGPVSCEEKEQIVSIAMALAFIWIVVTGRVGSPPRSLLIGEWVSAWAFGASFLAKGAEWDMLFGRPSPPVTPTA